MVRAFGLMRIGIGAAMFAAPRSLGRNDEVLMTRAQCGCGLGVARTPVTSIPKANTWRAIEPPNAPRPTIVIGSPVTTAPHSFRHRPER